ncbi:MAG: hypothetical protein WCG79_03010 [Verrucomicrobiota bacterium]|jgi:hypothetical protein
MIRHNFMRQQSIVIVFLLSLIAVYASAGSPTNAIDTLVKELNLSHGLWMNGTSPIIVLASNASPQEVVSNAATMGDGGKMKIYRILECRKVHLQGMPTQVEHMDMPGKLWDVADYFAALIDSNLGMKILLFTYNGVGHEKGNWWTRFYDVQTPSEPTALPSPSR